MSDLPQDQSRAVTDAMEAALRSASMLVPHLSGLARLVRIIAEQRVRTAGIFASGRLAVNPQWFLGLPQPARIFVAAHELLHLALRTHERRGDSDPQLFNIAHDYIINDMLRTALGMEVPAEGLDWPGAASLSAEKIYAELQSRQIRGQKLRTHAWGGSAVPALGALGEAMARAGLPLSGPMADLDAPVMDALDDAIERRWYPDARDVQSRKREALTAEGDRAVALGVWRDRTEKALTSALSISAGRDDILVETLESRLRPPWDLALQRWLEDVAPGPRSFGRASRRQGKRTDVVLAGR